MDIFYKYGCLDIYNEDPKKIFLVMNEFNMINIMTGI